MVNVNKTSEVLLNFNSMTTALLGSTGTDEYIWIAGVQYKYSATGTDFTDADGRNFDIYPAPTSESGSGNLAAVSTWEAIKVFTGITAGAENRERYSYTVRLGNDVNTQGFDSGIIFQQGGFPGSIFFASDTGTVPSWLRMNGPNLELNSPSALALDYAFEIETITIG